MYIAKTGRWTDALRATLRRVYEPTTRHPVPWFLSGEAALALQGVDAEPSAIEFRAVSPYAVAYFAGFLKPYETQANAATVIYRRGGDQAPSPSWRSNVHQPIVAWSANGEASWFGRWAIEGMPVEVLYARAAGAEPVAQVPPEDVRRVYYQGMDVAVAPVEYLLAQSAWHNHQQDSNRILHAMRALGHDPGVMQRALATLSEERATRLLRLLEIRLVAG